MAKQTSAEVLTKYIEMVKSNKNNIVGENALKEGKKIELRNYEAGGGFKEGDVITFSDYVYIPALRDGSKGKHLCCAATVQRGDACIGMTVYPAWFNNSVHQLKPGVDEDGLLQDSDEWWHHEGKPAEIARNMQGYESDLWARFNGCTIKVTEVYERECAVWERGTTEYKRENMVRGTRKFYNYEFVKDTAEKTTEK